MSKLLKALIIEDSEDDALLLLRELRKGGYDLQSLRVETEDAMKTALAGDGWDLIISDFVLPQFSGIAALDVLRRSGKDIPFIIVSGNIGEDIAVGAMKAGAHDYIIKGNLRRLVPAIERELQEAEVRRQRRRAEADIIRLNRLYSVLSKVNEAIVRVQNPEELYERACRIAVEDGGFVMAWIGLTDAETRRVVPVASAGDHGGYLRDVVITAADVPEGSGPTGRAVRHGAATICGDVEQDPLMWPWRDKALAHGYRSVAAFPLRSGSSVMGAITIYADRPQFFTGEETALLSSLAEDISYAIEKLENEQKRREAEQRTEVTNELLALFARKFARKEYLDAAIEVLRRWTGCRHAGVRVTDRYMNLPFESCSGYNENFLRTERVLSMDEDDCICTRIAAGTAEFTDRSAMTRLGSFYANDTQAFITGLATAERTHYRGHCMASGYRSLAVIPIRYQDRILGAIHIADERTGMVPPGKVEFLEYLAHILGEAILRFDIEEELRQNYENLRKSTELLERMFSNIHAMIAYLDRDFNFIRVNQRFAFADDREPEFYTGKGYFDLFPHEENERIFRTVVETGEPRFVFEQALTYPGRPERGVFYMDWSLMPVKDQEGAVSGVMLTLIDVTERKLAEAERTRLAAAVEAAADSIVITEPGRGDIQYVNEAFEQMTGYSRREAVGQNLHILDSGRQGEEFFRSQRETLEKDGVWRGRLINRKKDGTLYYEDCTLSPVRDRDGSILNYVSVKRDVTEKLRLESIAESVSMMDNIGYVFSGVRHEIGNPINSVNMILGLLRSKFDTLTPESIRDYVNRMAEQISRVEYILRSLKSFNLYETQQPQQVGIPVFLENFLPLVKDDFARKGIEIAAAVAPDAQWAFVDARALQQVLLNILTNAADALAGRSLPRVELDVSRQPGKIRIQVRDNGCGVPDDKRKNLFKPFFTTKTQGTGLGLVIVKKMLANMNGTIDIESTRDVGTLVTITIPEGAQ